MPSCMLGALGLNLELSCQATSHDFTAEPVHVCVRGEIQASRCRLVPSYLGSRALSRDLGLCAQSGAQICEQDIKTFSPIDWTP